MEAFNTHSHGKDATNQISALVFGIAIGGIVTVCALVHLLNKMATRWISKSTKCGRAITAVVNTSRCIFTTKTLSRTHGRIVIMLLYFATNITLTIINLNFSSLSGIARRLGWMAVCNLCLTVSLALKNTPLSLLVGKSYQHLNVLHRGCGSTTILFILAHGGLSVASMARRGNLEMLQSLKIGSAVIAGLSTLIMLATAVKFVRKGQYEMFKILHVVFAAVILFMVGYHTYATPILRQKSFFIVLAAAGLWSADRTLRGLRWTFSLYSNYCTITPLPSGATRVVMHRGIRSAKPGSHARLWIPSIRLLESHPFTLISSNEFVITAREGFTRKLYDLACQHPEGLRLRAAIDGPYGSSSVPTMQAFDKVVLIAGGAGACFTVPLALDWAREFEKRKPDASLEFVWAVKDRRFLEWFDEELSELQACSSVNLSLHVTEPAACEKVAWPFAEVEDSDDDADEEDEVMDEKRVYSGPPTIRVVAGLVVAAPAGRPLTPLPTPMTEKKEDEVEVEVREKTIKNPNTFWNLLKLSKFVMTGRPNVDDTLYAASEHLWRGKRVLVAACGPKSLLEDTRTAVTSRMKWDLPEMQLHLEEFE